MTDETSPQESELLKYTFTDAVLDLGLLTKEQVEEVHRKRRYWEKAGEKLSPFDAFVRSGLIELGHLNKARDHQFLHIFKEAIPGYDIKSVLGRGSMGAVFKGIQKRLERSVAIKVLYPHLAKDKKLKTRFLNEARAAARLNHVNIVTGIDAGDVASTSFFVMEFIDGKNAEDLVAERGPLDEAVATNVIREVGHALEHAEQKKILHRDIKPGNIMIGKDHSVKLLDLGLAAASGSKGKEKKRVGTPNYMAPEVCLMEGAPDIRSDLYSLGATYYYLLTGKAMFSGDQRTVMKGHARQPAPNPMDHRKDLSKAACALYYKLVAKDPDQRPQNAKELVADCNIVAQGGLVMLRSKAMQGTPPRVDGALQPTPQQVRLGAAQKRGPGKTGPAKGKSPAASPSSGQSQDGGNRMPRKRRFRPRPR